MNKIEINKELVSYTCPTSFPGNDRSWKLDLRNIKLIGRISKMVEDDDSVFLLLIDEIGNKHFINLTWKIDGFKEFEKRLKSRFDLDLTSQQATFYDSAKVLFPPEHLGKPLYKNSIVKSIRTGLRIDHVADGHLHDSLIDQEN